MTHHDREAVRVTREVAARAIRRLDILEWVILGVAASLAIAAGALVAWLVAPTIPWGFRPTWTVASVALFVVPGAIARSRARRGERDARPHAPPDPDRDD